MVKINLLSRVKDAHGKLLKPTLVRFTIKCQIGNEGNVIVENTQLQRPSWKLHRRNRTGLNERWLDTQESTIWFILNKPTDMVRQESKKIDGVEKKNKHEITV